MEKIIIGRRAAIRFLDHDVSMQVPAKIDTGADSSSVWASNIFVDDHDKLHFTLFSEESACYTGKEIVKTHFKVKVVRSSNGQAQIRYSVKLRVKLSGKRVLATFTLADRSQNNFPVLVGCRLLVNKFIVDVSRGRYEESVQEESERLTEESDQNPHLFFEKYFTIKDNKDSL